MKTGKKKTTQTTIFQRIAVISRHPLAGKSEMLGVTTTRTTTGEQKVPDGATTATNTTPIQPTTITTPIDAKNPPPPIETMELPTLPMTTTVTQELNQHVTIHTPSMTTPTHTLKTHHQREMSICTVLVVVGQDNMTPSCAMTNRVDIAIATEDPQEGKVEHRVPGPVYDSLSSRR
jgi:hypothetical protein